MIMSATHVKAKLVNSPPATKIVLPMRAASMAEEFLDGKGNKGSQFRPVSKSITWKEFPF